MAEPIGYRGRVASRFSGAHSTRSVDSKIYVPAEIRSRHSFSRAALKLSDIPEARPTRRPESRERQRLRGGNEPPQKKRRWMLRILGSTAINHRANSPFDFLFSLSPPFFLRSHRNCSFPFPFLKRDPFFVGSVLRSELLPFSRQWNFAPPSGRRRTRERFEIDSSFRKIEGRGGEERERASNNLVQHFHCRAIAFS